MPNIAASHLVRRHTALAECGRRLPCKPLKHSCEVGIIIKPAKKRHLGNRQVRIFQILHRKCNPSGCDVLQNRTAHFFFEQAHDVLRIQVHTVCQFRNGQILREPLRKHMQQLADIRIGHIKRVRRKQTVFGLLCRPRRFIFAPLDALHHIFQRLLQQRIVDWLQQIITAPQLHCRTQIAVFIMARHKNALRQRVIRLHPLEQFQS